MRSAADRLVVLDLDATVVTCSSRKQGAAGTFKGTWGHHPLGAWVANTRECLAMLLRPGNPAANDVVDHKSVLAAALRQLPLPLWSKLLIRIDGAAFSHDVLDHLQSLTTSRRRVRWVTGWAIHTKDAEAIALLPEQVWTAALRQHGEIHEIKGPDGETVSYQVAEITGLRDLTGRPAGGNAADRTPGQTLTPGPEETDRLRETHRLALPDRRPEHPRPPRTVHSARLRAGVVRRRPLP
ncbi:transposase [Streptomyces sp. NBC_01614]|uniref:transposase n=1 Tax=Streptomyces sp. NBC_01614 TaxID=2975897 RepID=UPI003863A4D9